VDVRRARWILVIDVLFVVVDDSGGACASLLLWRSEEQGVLDGQEVSESALEGASVWCEEERESWDGGGRGDLKDGGGLASIISGR
jgi:hypothetical protein